MQLPQFDHQDVEIVEKRTIWQGYFKMVKYFFRHRLYAGGQSALIERELFERGHAVAVIPYDPITDEVVLIEQFRVGALAGKQTPWLIEVVAGIIEEGEEPVDVAQRELAEESGLSAISIEQVMSFLTSPGGTSERIDLFLAHVDSTTASKIAGLEDEGEDIKVLRLNVDDAIAALDSGLIINGPTVIALQWLARHLSCVRKDFLAASEV